MKEQKENEISKIYNWDKSRIEEFLRTEELKYQKIKLPFGLSTPGAERDDLIKLIFGSDIVGRSVLDIGSYLGYFCFEALEQGAKSAHGVEVDPTKISTALKIAEMKGLAPTFENSDVESFSPRQKYDVVLCLNVLHHLFDPIGSLHKLANITDHKLVLEVASINPRDGRKLKIGPLMRHLISKLPVIFVARGVPKGKRHSDLQKYFFTPKAISHILQDHMKLFATVEIVPSSFKQRFIVVATRRKINTLVIVSGPTSSGKSTFLRKLKAGQLPHTLIGKLPRQVSEWPQIGASRLLDREPVTLEGTPLPETDLDGLVLHYDIMRPYVTGTQDFARDQILDLVKCAKKVVVIVIRPDIDDLASQLQAAEIDIKPVSSASDIGRRVRDEITARIKPKRKGRYVVLLEHYRRAGWLAAWYARWEAFLKVNNAQIITVRSSDGELIE